MSDSDDKRQRDLWIWARRRAIGQMDLSFGARECWRLLEGFPPGRCYPTHWWIAEHLRRSRSAVCRYLQELKQRGYIEITVHFDHRGQTANVYVVLDQPDLFARATQIFQDRAAKNKSG